MLNHFLSRLYLQNVKIKYVVGTFKPRVYFKMSNVSNTANVVRVACLFTHISVNDDFILTTFIKFKRVMPDYHELDNIIVQKSSLRLIRKKNKLEENIEGNFIKSKKSKTEYNYTVNKPIKSSQIPVL